MTREIKILHLGEESYLSNTTLPQGVNLDFMNNEDLEILDVEEFLKKLKLKKLKYDLVMVTDENCLKQVEKLDKLIEPYRMIVEKNLNIDDENLITYLENKNIFKINILSEANKTKLLIKLKNSFYPGQSYGDKFMAKDFLVNKNFNGDIKFIGSGILELKGNFGEDYKQVANLRYNIIISTPVEIWPEFEVSEGVSIGYNIQLVAGGGSTVVSDKYYYEDDLKKPIIIEQEGTDYVCVSIIAKGKGTLSIKTIHYRETRYEFGKFVPGGNIFSDKNRDEFAYYYNPGDLKPPLNVYFSGYKTLEGFEGYGIMKGLKSPFMLISDARLEGGAFYLGSKEYEARIKDLISEKLDQLGFTSEQLIVSGMSMGTFGAMYYGSMLAAKAIIVAKPIGNLGVVSSKERTTRPNMFGTSLDMLKLKIGDFSEEGIEKFNDMFWKVFLKGDFTKTSLIISYMRHEDYDDKVVFDLIKRLRQTGAKIIIKGVDGRHNDNQMQIVSWYYNYYKEYLRTNFGR